MPGVTTSTVLNTDSALKAREIDFVTRFDKNWDALRTILGIFKPIRKEPGTSLVTYEAQMKDEALQGGASVGEGEAIPFTQFKVVESKREDIVVEKYAKSLSLESVSKWGATVAIEKTDDAFMVELQNKVLKDFYTFLKTGTLKGTQKKWQKALAIAKGAVLNKFAGMNRNVTEVVGFANVMDFYDWLGDKEITVQTISLASLHCSSSLTTTSRQKPSSQHRWKILIYIILIPVTAISKSLAWTTQHLAKQI